MIKVGVDIGNSKISCIVYDVRKDGYKKILSLVSNPTNSIKKSTNCILTPHIAGVTEESNTRVSEFIANTVLEFFKL